MSPITRSVSIFTRARSGACCARSTNGAANRVLENCRRERIIGVGLCDAEAAEKDLANDQHSWVLLWSAQACLRLDGLGTNSTRRKAAASCRTPKSTVDHSFGCGWAAPCSSVFICGFIHPFGCGAHQVNFSKETPCRGRLRFRLTRPLAAGSNLADLQRQN